MIQPSLPEIEWFTMRTARAAWVKAVKKQHDIWTHKGEVTQNWMALCLPECHEALSGYELPQEVKENPVLMMAGYCRLLDEADLIEDGHRTEFKAVKAVMERLIQIEKRRSVTPCTSSTPPPSAPPNPT